MNPIQFASLQSSEQTKQMKNIHPKIVKVLKGLYPDESGHPAKYSYWEDEKFSMEQKLQAAREWFEAEAERAIEELIYNKAMLKLC